MKRSLACWLVVSCGLALTLALPALAEEVEKKLRVSVSLGQYNTRQALGSDSANILTIVDSREQFVTYFEDPRSDNAALGELAIRPGNRVVATVQYGISRFFLVEASAGYQQGDVGSIEMQAEFFGTKIEPIERHKYVIYNYKAGKMTQVPLQLTAIARLRPKARLNPYLGFGVGYTAVGFQPSASLNTLSGLMDGLVGGQTRLSPYPATQPLPPAGAALMPMTGARVSADNYWDWHAVGGMEYSLKRKWSMYADLRYETASRSFVLGFNGSDSVGVSLPNRQAVRGTPTAQAQYGPMSISNGGLVDGGRAVNPDLFNSVPVTPGICSVPDPTRCVFLRNFEMVAYNAKNKDVPGFVPVQADGVPDPGYYYVKGGSIRYSGTSLQIGVRYAF